MDCRNDSVGRSEIEIISGHVAVMIVTDQIMALEHSGDGRYGLGFVQPEHVILFAEVLLAG